MKRLPHILIAKLRVVFDRLSSSPKTSIDDIKHSQEIMGVMMGAISP